MTKGSYEIEVLVNGRSVKEYYQDGKTFIEGKKGSPFSIRLRNNSGQRKLFVPSVDGLSVMNGKDASEKSRGYIVQPWSSLTVVGWRKSDDSVAEFYFSAAEDSYRRRQEKGNNLGVIGVRVYGEKYKRPATDLQNIQGDIIKIKRGGIFGCDEITIKNGPTWMTGAQSHNNLSCGSSPTASALSCSDPGGVGGGGPLSGFGAGGQGAGGAGAAAELGTGWGKEKHSSVITVEFDRDDYPDESFYLYYNTREQLVKEGVRFVEPVYVERPKAFPGDYCEPPRN